MAQHADQGMNKNEGPHWNWNPFQNSFLYSLVTILRDSSNELSLNDWNTADTVLNSNQLQKNSPNESTETEALYEMLLQCI